MYLQRGVDQVHVGDVDGDQRVQQRIVGEVDGGPPPQPPDELLAMSVVDEAEVELVQRHRRRGTGRPGPWKRLRIGTTEITLTVLRPG